MRVQTNKMFKFWYEKFLMRFSFVFAFLAFLGVFVYAYFTEITIKLPKEVAPFTETLIGAQTTTILPEQRYLPLEKPHRGNKEIQNWISMVISESLSFDKQSYSATAKNIRPYYTNSGFRQYLNYLKAAGIIDSIRANNYRMSVYVETPPLLQNSLAIEGVYRWLYQMPVTVSFLPRGASHLTYGNKDMINRKLTLNVQLRRVKRPTDPNVIEIESWTVTGRR